MADDTPIPDATTQAHGADDYDEFEQGLIAAGMFILLLFGAPFPFFDFARSLLAHDAALPTTNTGHLAVDSNGRLQEVVAMDVLAAAGGRGAGRGGRTFYIEQLSAAALVLF